uniref:Werner syndrome ATP-dependent helicase n=1 Tax=Magallana gigas TaxID=29159 RepID=K1RAP0_MAGGI
MGVNFQNVNNIVHYGPPRDLDNLVQQMGRAGRDGTQSNELIIYKANQLKKVDDDIVSALQPLTRDFNTATQGLDFIPNSDGFYDIFPKTGTRCHTGLNSYDFEERLYHGGTYLAAIVNTATATPNSPEVYYMDTKIYNVQYYCAWGLFLGGFGCVLVLVSALGHLNLEWQKKLRSK